MGSGAADRALRVAAYPHTKRGPANRAPSLLVSLETYFRWFERCLFISNMLTRSLPPKIGFSVESAMISRLFCGFCRLFLRMWSHTFETTWLRGSGALPVIFARSADG